MAKRVRKNEDNVDVQDNVNVVTEPAPELITFKKVGGGAFRFENRIIKPGQVFKATWEQIPKAFHNLFEVVADTKNAIVLGNQVKKKPEPEKYVKSEFTIQEIEGEETVNIVDSQGKVINDEPLEKEEAEKLIKSL